VLGVTSVEDWIDRALADLETSALESHVGRWLEDVARIVSEGFKPGSGVDVQREIGDDVVELYSLQMAANTKSSGGSQAEINNLRQAAAPLRTHGGMRVTTIVGVMYGRKSSRPSEADPNILKPSSEELWERLTGQKGFLPRLLAEARLLSVLVGARARDEAERLKIEAARLFAAEEGMLDLGSSSSLLRGRVVERPRRTVRPTECEPAPLGNLASQRQRRRHSWAACRSRRGSPSLPPCTGPRRALRPTLRADPLSLDPPFRRSC
jgi:Type II restriction endonuclease EcoO109I